MGIPAIISSVPAQTPYIQYIATSGQTVFPYPFVITQDSDLIVVDNGNTLSTDQGYTLSGVGNSNGGNVTFTSGATTGDIITLYRDIPIERITQIGQNSGFSSTAFNAEYNNIYLILQQLNETFAQVLQTPITNTKSGAGTVLTPALYANKYLSFDANGNPIPALLTSSGTLTAAIIGALYNGQTTAEFNAGYTVNTLYTIGNPFRYGSVGDGVTDDTAAITAALTICTGGTLYLPYMLPNGTSTAKFLVGNITVPQNTAIRGAVPYPTLLATSAGGLQVNPYNLGSQLRTKAGCTITMLDGATITDALLIHAGLSLPATTNTQATTLLAEFADIAITASQASVRLERLMILGYYRATYITNSGGVNLSSRAMIRDVMGDNINGVYITDSADVSHVSGCHMFPFLTFGISGVSDTNLSRTGTAYFAGNVDDWFTFFDNFEFGYATGYASVDTSAVAFLRCQCDHPATGGGTNAFLITNSVSHSEYASIIDCQAIGYLNPCLIVMGSASPTGNNTAQVIGNKFIYSAGGVGLEASTGTYLVADDNLIQGAGTAIQLDSGCAGGLISNNRLVGAITPIANAATGPVVIKDNPGYNPVGVAAGSPFTVGASPATITAGASPETHYLKQSATNTATVGKGGKTLGTLSSATLPLVVQLGPNESYVVTWTTTAPTYIQDVH